MKKIKYFLVTVSVMLSSFGMGFLALAPAHALFEDAKSEACKGLALGDTTAPNCDPDAPSGLDRVLTSALNIFSLVVGVIAVIMIIINGIKFITSQGEAQSVSSARSGIIYAVVGLVIVGLAQFIVRFVLSQT